MPRLYCLLLSLLMLCMLSVAIGGSASATTISFDTDAAGNPLTVPSHFSQTTRLTTLYSSLGVTFAGPGGNDGGAILDQNGNFGVPALSGRNFLAFNRDNPAAAMVDGGRPRDPETILFSVPVATVSIQAAGGNTVDSFVMQAFNSSNVLIGIASYTGQSFGALSISAPGITRVVLAETGEGIFVYDNLVFEFVPEPGTGLLVIAGLLGLGVRRRARDRRESGRIEYVSDVHGEASMPL